jgi:demethylmenaquinone methyltransferase/2-methoxy-6-polyprenyl-1,4-benzoquinol methylase
VHDVSHFDRVAPVYDLLVPTTDPAPLSAGLATATRPVERVVDLGGGTGRASRSLSNASVVVDASQPMLAKARDHDHPTVRGDVRSLPLATDSVDAIVTVDAVHHLPDVETVLAEAKRVLQPGGVIVVRDFDPQTVRGRALSLAERVVGFDSEFFSLAHLVDSLSAIGFETTVLERGFPYTVAGRVTDAAE